MRSTFKPLCICFNKKCEHLSKPVIWFTLTTCVTNLQIPVFWFIFSTGHAIFSKHRNAQNLPDDNVYPLIHPKEKKFRVPRSQLPRRKPHLKV